MLWEKKNPKKPNERGYLYLRESLYIRDGRSHIRKPKKLGNGKAYKERGKYTHKKDIYCGKIIEVIPQSLITFREYLALENIEFIEYRLKKSFEEILSKFVEYLLYMHNIDKSEFEKGIKKAYEISTGYLSKETIENIRKFVIRGKNTENKNEIERFANRCYDAAIFDEEVIMALYTKITPDIKNKEQLEDEIKQLKDKGLKTKHYKSFHDYMRREHNL